MFDRTNLGDLENSLPSWISDHLGKKSYMKDYVNMSPSSPNRVFSSSEGSPLGISLPLSEEEKITTLDELDRLRESYFIPPSPNKAS